MNLIGGATSLGRENPFTTADALLSRGTADFTLVDFHAQATSRSWPWATTWTAGVSALGTHAPVPTADERVLPQAPAISRTWA